MAKISELPDADDLDGTELVPVVKGNAVRKAGLGKLISSLVPGLEPASSSLWALAFAAATTKKILAGVKQTGEFFANDLQVNKASIVNLTFEKTALGTAKLRTKKSAKSSHLLLSSDEKSKLLSVAQDGYIDAMLRPKRRETVGASSVYSAWTKKNGANWDVQSQAIGSDNATRTVLSSPYYRDIVGVQGRHIICRTESGRLMSVGADDAIVRSMHTVDAICCVGDSITGGAGGANYITPLIAAIQARTGRTISVYNNGVGGQTANEVAARMDAYPITIIGAVTVPARATAENTVATAGERVAVTLSQRPLTEQGPQAMTCLFNGMLVSLYREANGSFTVARRYRGANMAVPAASRLRPKVALNTGVDDVMRRLHIIGVGNNPTREYCDESGQYVLPQYLDAEAQAILARTQEIVNRLEAVNARYIIRTSVRPIMTWTYNGSTVVDDSAARANALLKLAFVGNVDDIRALLMANGDGSAGDLEDQAAGNVPRSRRIDGIHLDQPGHDICATLHAERIVSKGLLE